MRDGNASCHGRARRAQSRWTRCAASSRPVRLDRVRPSGGAADGRVWCRWLPEHVTAMDAGVAHTRTRSLWSGAGGAHSPVSASGLIGATSPRIPGTAGKTLSGRRPARITVWTCPHRPAGPPAESPFPGRPTVASLPTAAGRTIPTCRCSSPGRSPAGRGASTHVRTACRWPSGACWHG